MTRDSTSRILRAVAASVLGVVMAASVTGCGAGQTLLGIHDAPTALASSVPLTADHARRILIRTFTAAYQGETATGAVAQAALRTAYSGEGLRAARARVRLAGVQRPLANSPLLAQQQPLLLAVSRGVGFPRFIIAQSVVLQGGVPVMHLLTSPNAATPYRISMSAEMMPLVQVEPFDPVSQGSPLVADGSGLVVTPAALLNLYAARMAFPTSAVTNPPFAADPFSADLRARANEVARNVATQATFSQVHEVVNGSTYAVRQSNGDALVFGVIQRTDSFAVKAGQAVSTVANKEFVRLTAKKTITRSASIATLETVIFTVPRSTGRATLVAAREQVLAASGS
jgi:hypothetical protein